MGCVETINKLSFASKQRLETYSDIKIRCECRDDKDGVQWYKNKINGYLECLNDMNVITQAEVRLLWIYYATVRKVEKNGSICSA